MESDWTLVRRVVAHDPAAFETLFAQYGDAVRRHLARIVRDTHAADDLAQEVFFRLWTRADQWSGEGAFRAWLFRIATNLALNHLRAQRRRRQQPLEAPSTSADDYENSPALERLADATTLGPDALLEMSERHDLAKRLIDELPEEKREVLRMVCEAHLELREVAARLGIPEGTVKSRIHYATKRLAQEWRDRQHDGAP